MLRKVDPLETDFKNVHAVLPRGTLDKFGVLINYVSPTTFQFIEDCKTYAPNHLRKTDIRNLSLTSTRTLTPTTLRNLGRILATFADSQKIIIVTVIKV